ncbi:hypothetical protein AHAS_Ahas04G0209300 [Arachis hypogaea]
MNGVVSIKLYRIALLLLYANAKIMLNIVDSPIFTEIVPEKFRAVIYALDRSFESILALFAPPFVGLLAQHIYGYKPIPKGLSDSVDRENTASLAKILYTTTRIPMIICCSIYSFLYCTYPRDRERVRMIALVD